MFLTQLPKKPYFKKGLENPNMGNVDMGVEFGFVGFWVRILEMEIIV